MIKEHTHRKELFKALLQSETKALKLILNPVKLKQIFFKIYPIENSISKITQKN